MTIKFCQCLDIPNSVVRHLSFLKNAEKLDPFDDKMTLEQKGFIGFSNVITVLDVSNVYAA